MKTRRVARLSLFLGTLVLFVPAAAHAQDKGDVKRSEQLAQQAYEAHAKGDFTTALALYKDAYKAAPVGVVLFNIANVYDKKLHDRDAALDYYRRYLTAPDAEPDLAKRANDR